MTDKLLDTLRKNYLTKINYENKIDRKGLIRDDLLSLMTWNETTSLYIGSWLSREDKANPYHIDKSDLDIIFNKQIELQNKIIKEKEEQDHSFSIETPGRPKKVMY